MDRLSAPKERLLAFVRIGSKANRERLARGMSTWQLCSELHKEGGALAKEIRGALY